MRSLFFLVPVFGLMACGESSPPATVTDAPDAAATAQEPVPVRESKSNAEGDRLALILSGQPDEIRARYVYRNPLETLKFFGIEPGMTVLEGLPGRGWYTNILMDYLGPYGTLLAANYDLDMYPLFSFADEAFLAEQAAWKDNWQNYTADWGGEEAAATEAFHFGSMPEKYAGTADAVILARVLHNAARFENAGEGSYLTDLLADAHAALKPGGVLGIVQHEAREDKADAWADGSRGYLKRSFVIDAAEAAGFEFVAASDVNQNPADQPGEDDIVWRLPPSLATSGDDEALRERLFAVGESNRMTLKFRKPGT